MQIQKIRPFNFKSNYVAQSACYSNATMPQDFDVFEKSQQNELSRKVKFEELKNLKPKDAPIADKTLKGFSQYQGDDYEFIKAILPYANKDGGFNLDKIDPDTKDKLEDLPVQCPKLRSLQEQFED